MRQYQTRKEYWEHNKDIFNARRRKRYRNDEKYREWDKARHPKRGKFDFNANMERGKDGRFLRKKPIVD